MKLDYLNLARFTLTLALISTPLVMCAEDSEETETVEIEEVIVEHQRSYVEYQYTVNSVGMFASPVDVLKPISSLAFDNSIGQIRSRGSGANHIGIHIDGYDIADPVSDFNFATISCADALTYFTFPRHLDLAQSED